jgi:hypothetical protein
MRLKDDCEWKVGNGLEEGCRGLFKTMSSYNVAFQLLKYLSHIRKVQVSILGPVIGRV